jgi:hypothetical protein
MKNITEKKLYALGFERQDVTEEELVEHEKPYYYFTFVTGKLCLITNTSDQCIKGKYFVEFFDYPDIGKYEDVFALTILIEALSLAK